VNKLVESELGERSRERLARSQEAVQRMLALIQADLSDEVRPPAQAHGFASARDVLGAVVSRVEDRAEAGRVALVVQAGTGGVVGDFGELTQALANLVVNAIEATSSGGAVFVATRQLPDGSQVWAVRDTGARIPERVEGTARDNPVPDVPRQGGSGIGFAVVRRVVEQHGGQMHVRSMRGSGTVVSLRLPACAETADHA
jgi:signal transduction histidine kinase